MQFTFLDMAGKTLFLRDDAERAQWTQEEMSLELEFPRLDDKVISIGQRVFFIDPSTGAHQIFEVKQAQTHEPDHYQTVNAEHICISELTDEHIDNKEFTGVPPQTALQDVLAGTLWGVGEVQVGNVGAQQAIRNQIDALGLDGNVDLTARPIIYPAKMWAAGYTDFDGDYATLYSMTYTENIKGGALYTLLMTPIQTDGEVLTQDEIDTYVSDLCKASSNAAELKENDNRGLLIHNLPGEQIAAMDIVAEQAHDLSDQWETLNEGILSSADIARGSVWQAVLDIKANWNVYIEPRVVLAANGTITRYLDILPTDGTWNGVRLSIDKNMLDPAVTFDDSEVVTAMYGYGGTTTPTNKDEKQVEIDFSGVEWESTSEHPAKPLGQKYIEDPAATAEFGRNGRARFGFYQNTDITDPELLLNKTWESLQANSKPAISIDGTVADLYRMGYADQPIKLHDIALVEVNPAGYKDQIQIIQMTVDLLDASATTLTIGAYIPNIVYIDRQLNIETTGTSGGGGNKSKQTVRSEYETAIEKNNRMIMLRAYQYDVNDMDKELKEQEARITVEHNRITQEVTDRRQADTVLDGKITVEAGRITQEVTERQNGDTVLAGQITVEKNRITQEVTDRTNADNTLSGRITVEANRITQEVTDRQGADEALSGRITIEKNRITQEVTDRTNADNVLDGKITVEAGRITQEVTRATTAEGTLSGRITTTEDNITAEVTRATTAEGTLSGRISVNADNITAEVTRATTAEGTLSGRISVNADNITAEVTRATDAEGTLSGRISVNADNITAEVTRATGAESGLSGRLDVQADKIGLVVEEKDGQNVVKAASIVAGINAQTGSYVKIQAQTINLSGYVTASQLSATDAKIDNLTSGATTASTLKTNLLSAGTGFTYQSHSISFKTITIDGTTYHLMGY